MSTTTTNYNLVKPALTDAADITATNQNWDIIDAELAKKAELNPDGKIPPEQLPISASWDITVPTEGWTVSDDVQYIQLPVSGMTSDINPTYGMKPVGNYSTEAEDDAFALIKGLTTSTNAVTVYATEAPTTSITLTLKEG